MGGGEGGAVTNMCNVCSAKSPEVQAVHGLCSALEPVAADAQEALERFAAHRFACHWQ